MINQLGGLDELTIPKCYPNCCKCPGIWANRVIKHRIICRCCKTNHRKVRSQIETKQINHHTSRPKNDTLNVNVQQGSEQEDMSNE